MEIPGTRIAHFGLEIWNLAYRVLRPLEQNSDIVPKKIFQMAAWKSKMAANCFTKKFITQDWRTFLYMLNNKNSTLAYFTIAYQLSNNFVHRQQSYGTLKLGMIIALVHISKFKTEYFQNHSHFLIYYIRSSLKNFIGNTHAKYQWPWSTSESVIALFLVSGNFVVFAGNSKFL